MRELHRYIRQKFLPAASTDGIKIREITFPRTGELRTRLGDYQAWDGTLKRRDPTIGLEPIESYRHQSIRDMFYIFACIKCSSILSLLLKSLFPRVRSRQGNLDLIRSQLTFSRGTPDWFIRDADDVQTRIDWWKALIRCELTSLSLRRTLMTPRGGIGHLVVFWILDPGVP